MKTGPDEQAHFLEPPTDRVSIFGPYIEAALLVGILGLFVAALGSQTPNGLPSPFWIPVLTMAALRGTGPAAFAALLSITLSAHMGWLLLETEAGFYEDLIAMFDEPALWLLATLVIGEPTRLRLQRQRALQKELALEAERQRVVSLYADSLRQKISDLEHQIATSPGEKIPVASPLARLNLEDMTDQETLQHVIVSLFGSGSGDILLSGTIVDVAQTKQRIMSAERPKDRKHLRGFDLAVPLFDGKGKRVLAVLALRDLPSGTRGMMGEACAMLLAYVGQNALSQNAVETSKFSAEPAQTS
ncbi:MAG: hypothetical protein AAGH43_07210 [Pseudomonadota bacterium]